MSNAPTNAKLALTGQVRGKDSDLESVAVPTLVTADQWKEGQCLGEGAQGMSSHLSPASSTADFFCS